MRVELTRVGPSGILETAIKELDGPITSDLNQHRLDVLQYGLVINANLDSCSWATYKVIP